MTQENFRKAESLMKEIDSIEGIIKDYSLGTVSSEIDFTENNNDFYTANFIKIFETKTYHNTGGGHSELARLTAARHKDMSGPKYYFTKQEIIKIQEFIKSIMDYRLEVSKNELNKI